jgi:ADP-heptose:LPS heptosyltransferase
MKVLVIRTSAMGDVALVTPVIKSMSIQHPDTELVILTRPPFESFFYSFSGVTVFSADFKGRYSGLTGMSRVFHDLRKKYRFDHVIDLHDVIRSRLIRWMFGMTGVRVTVIDKGRSEKRSLLDGSRKVKLIHSVERYYNAFAKAGFPLERSEGPWIVPRPEGISRAENLLREKELLHIGVAPLAKHGLKMWPEKNMISLMEMIAKYKKVRFWLFGGKEETPQLISMQNRIPESVLIAGTLSLDEELAIISRLKFMISMDSSNMHMAALSGTKVISIWGGTDPLAGFGAWHQPDEYSIRIPVEDLTCRPCTVYGKGTCRRGDFACMDRLKPEMVFEKIIEIGLL